jgi:hypothetical protein
MTYTDKEKKLIAVAMNGAAHSGELANAGAAFFKSIKKRRVRYADMVNGTDTTAELVNQVASLITDNVKLMEKLSVAQAANIELNDQVESVTAAAKEKEADLYSKMGYLVSGWDMIDYQRDQAMWHTMAGKIKIEKLRAEVMKLTRELGGQMVSEDVRAHHAFWANHVMPPWDVEHEGHEIKIRDGSLLINGVDHVNEWLYSDIECPLSFAKWVIAGRDQAVKWRYQPIKLPDTLAEIRADLAQHAARSRESKRPSGDHRG